MTIRVEHSNRSLGPISYAIDVPVYGPWSAIVQVAHVDTLAPGPCTVGGWTGTIRRIRRTGGVSTLEIWAGGDGLNKPTTQTHWAGFTDSAEVARTLAAEAGETVDTPVVALGSWRAKGRALRDEIAALARWVSGGAWRYTPAGALTLEPPTWAETAAPGKLLSGGGGWTCYAAESLAELAGATVEGERIGLASFWYRPGGVPSVDLRSERLIVREAPALEGGTLEALAEGRATIRLDSGLVMGDVPLWFLPGVRAVVPAGVRVILVDLGGDPRQPIAFAAPFDGGAEEVRIEAASLVSIAAPTVELAGAQAFVLRSGDIMSIRNPDGSNLSGPLAPLSTAPITLVLHPSVDDPVPPGAPGTGHSAVRA